MEVKELIKKDKSTLHRLLAEEREKMRALRFKDASKQLKNVRELREVKKTISRILTLLNVREDEKKAEDKIVEKK